MGYRSEVCIGMTDDASRLFMTILSHLPEGHEAHSLLKDAPDGDYMKRNFMDPSSDMNSKLYWEYLKWYDGFECVDFINDFLCEAIPEDEYRFVRIGEETDDVEERGQYWDSDIYITRSISW